MISERILMNGTNPSAVTVCDRSVASPLLLREDAAKLRHEFDAAFEDLVRDVTISFGVMLCAVITTVAIIVRH
jgi:hypothetical protein